MCWNRTNCNGNVMGTSGRRCNNNNDNVAGESRRRCRCDCRWVNDNVAGEATRIAVRGPGCINGTGRCDRFAVESERGFESFCGQVSPFGNTQLESDSFRRRRCDCRCFNRCLSELLDDIFDNSNECPR